MNTKNHTDIKSLPWIERHFSEKIVAYIRLMRFDRPIGIWLLVIPGWWSIVLASGGIAEMNGWSWYVFILFAFGAIVMRAAGCIINDIWDRNIDREVGRTIARPLASGKINLLEAGVTVFFLLMCGFVILLQLGFITILLGFLSLPLIIAYPYMKRISWWPQAFLGITFNLGALMGWSAITGIIGLPALWLYFAGIMWTLGYDTIYAHQDKEDDLRLNLGSTALYFGEKSKLWVSGFYASAFFFLILSVFFGGVSFLSIAFMVLPAAHLVYQLIMWKPESPESSLKIFQSNRIFGLLMLLALALSSITF